jgi:DNA-binding CsgD family transcriptional regulator
MNRFSLGTRVTEAGGAWPEASDGKPNVAGMMAPVLGEMFGKLGLATASLSASGQILDVNQSFSRLIPDVLLRGQNRVSFRDRRCDRILEEALNAGSPDISSWQIRFIPIRAGQRNGPMLAYLLRLVDEPSGTVRLLLLVRDLASAAIPSPGLAQSLFDLTPAETRVAEHIAQGCTVNELSAQWGVATGTIRGQLKAVFAKTGARRQADLARIFARLTV